MSEPKGPWDLEPDALPRPSAPAPHRPFQPYLWIGLLVAVGAGVWALSRLFPGAVSSGQDWANVVYGLGLVAVVSAGLLRVQRVNLGQMARHLVIWVAVIAVLAVGYSSRGELGALTTRVRSDFMPGGVITQPRQMVVSQDDQGAFLVVGQVNGQTVRFAVDTGSSDIVLTPADARRLGVDVSALTFGRVTETANGEGRTARYMARSLDVGQLHFTKVAMDINAKPMSASLLGMSFLNRLESYQVKDGRMYLTWRG